MPALTLPDPDDRHVLAAAIFGRCDAIVTQNLKDFPPESLSPFGIESQHPEDFYSEPAVSRARFGLLSAAQSSRAPQEPTQER